MTRGRSDRAPVISSTPCQHGKAEQREKMFMERRNVAG